MKHLVSFIFVLLLAGCGDSRIRELRAEFIDGCKFQGGKRDVCACVFDKIEDEYSTDTLLDMKIGVIPRNFENVLTKSTLQCVRDN